MTTKPSSRSRSTPTERAQGTRQAKRSPTGLPRGHRDLYALPPEILDVLPIQIAILDARGVIVQTNRAWQKFTEQNATPEMRAEVGRNYPELCRRAVETHALRGAAAILNGLETVLHRDTEQTVFESAPAFDGTEHYFETTITRLPGATPLRVVISRQEITQYKMVAEELRSSQERLHQVADSAPLVVWSMDRNYIVTSLDGAPLARLGIEPQTIIGHSALERLARLPEIQGYVKRALEGETVSARVSSGDLILDTRYAPIKNAREEIVGVVGISLENTKLARTEQELSASEARWRALAENAPAVITILDRDGAILNVNRDVYGIPPETLLGANTFDYLPPDIETAARQNLADVFNTGQGGNFEVNAISPAGEPIWLKVHFAPILENGAVKSAISVATDITALKKTETQLLAAEARWRSILESVPAIVTMLDAAGTILSLNRNFGPFSPAQLIGRNVFEFIPAEKAAQSEQSLARVFEQGQTISYEIEVPGPAGEPQWLSVNLGPVTIGSRVDSAIGIILDITREKQSSLALRRAHAEMEQRVLERTSELSMANAALERIAIEQAALAQENAALYLSLKKQYALAETLNDVALALGSTLDSNVVLEGILAQAQRFVPYDAANVMLIRDDMAQVVRAIGYDKFGVSAPTRIELEIKQTPFLSQSLATGEPVIVEDILEVPGWVPLTETNWMRSYACVPMRARGVIFGFLNVDSITRGAFTREHVDLLQALATLGAVALDNARLYESAHRSAQQLEALSHSLVQGQENERRRIARELHDEIGQAVTSQLVDYYFMEKHLENTEALATRLAELKQRAKAVLEGVHRLIANLLPATLEHFGFTAGVRQYVEIFQQQHPELQVEFNHIGSETQRLPAEMEVALYRIVQESLTNIARHAHARRVEVAITQKTGRIAVVIWDNGVGFDPDVVAGTGRLGLAGMQERARMLGGTLEIESVPMQGTTVQVEVIYGN